MLVTPSKPVRKFQCMVCHKRQWPGHSAGSPASDHFNKFWCWQCRKIVECRSCHTKAISEQSNPLVNKRGPKGHTIWLCAACEATPSRRHDYPAAGYPAPISKLTFEDFWAARTCQTAKSRRQAKTVRDVGGEAILRSIVANGDSLSSLCSHDPVPSEVSEVNDASVIAVVGSDARCYFEGTSFRFAAGDFIRVEDIKDGVMLRAVDGSLVEVMINKRYTLTDETCVWLSSDSFSVPLTYNHPVVVLRGERNKQTIPAGHLRSGHRVLTSTGQVELNDATMPFIADDVDVFEMTFKPNTEMETFFIENASGGSLLTKAKSSPIRNRRGGMNKGAPPSEVVPEAVSPEDAC